MGKKSRTKGHTHEREMAKELRPFYPGAKRGLQYQDGANCADVEETPWFVEAKHYARMGMFRHYEQAKAYKKDGKDDRPVLLLLKEDYKPTMACVELDVFLEMLKAWEASKCS